MFDSRDASDGLDELKPRVALRRQNLLALGRQAVVAASALARLLDPATLNPAALLKPVEQRVERRDVEAQQPARALLDEAPDLVAVARAVFDEREDEQFG